MRINMLKSFLLRIIAVIKHEKELIEVYFNWLIHVSFPIVWVIFIHVKYLDTLLSQCLSPPRSKYGYWRIVREA